MRQDKDWICKYCKAEIVFRSSISAKWVAKTVSPDGYFYMCEGRDEDIFSDFHEPMDNLDYVEYLAKQRGLVV